MSTLSKLFIILVFVIALVKLGIDATLFAHKVDWKDKFIKEVNYHYRTQQIKNAEIAARDVELENRNQMVDILNERIAVLSAEDSSKAQRIQDLQKSLSNSETLLAKMEADVQVFVRQLEVQLNQIQELTAKVEEHRTRLAKALNEKTLLAAEVQYARQQAERLQHDLAQLEEKHVELAREKLHLQEKINHLNQLGVRTDVAPKKALEGKVTAVAVEIGMVVISIGRDAGVGEGDEFTIYRGGEFVAKIVINKVDRQWSAGEVVLKKQDPRVSDDVSNHIFVSAPKPSGGR